MTLKELLNKLMEESETGVPANGKTLPNTTDTWRRIGEKDGFQELGLEKSALAKFLSDWTADNDYQSIS